MTNRKQQQVKRSKRGRSNFITLGAGGSVTFGHRGELIRVSVACATNGQASLAIRIVNPHSGSQTQIQKP